MSETVSKTVAKPTVVSVATVSSSVTPCTVSGVRWCCLKFYVIDLVMELDARSFYY